jgi:hypothetical protein
MTKLLITSTALLAFAGTAHAGQIKAETAKTVTPTVQTAESAKIVTIDNQPTAVLGVIERDGETLYRVEGPTGDEFVNHVPDTLVPVTTDIDVLDTYTFEYEGRTFTNRVVSADAETAE